MNPSAETLDILKEFREEVKEHMVDTRDRLMRLETSLADVPKRVGALEKFKWQMLGAVGVISAAVSYIFRHIL